MPPGKDGNTSEKPYDKSIRQRLTGTVLIPSITLLVLWTVVSSIFFINGFYVRAVAASVRDVSIPAVAALSALQQERRLVLQFLDDAGPVQARLTDQRMITDERLVTLGAAFDQAVASAPEEITDQITALRGQFGQLPVLRVQIDLHSIDRAQVSAYYDGVLDAASDLFDTQARVVPDADAALGGITATSVFRAAEVMSRESSLVAAAFEAEDFTPDSFTLFTQQSGFYRAQLDQIAPFLAPPVRSDFEALAASSSWQQLIAAEEALVRYGPWSGPRSRSVPVTAAQWQRVTDEVAERLNEIAVDQADQVSAAALDSADSQLRNAIIGSVVVLLASLVAIVVAVRVSRSLVDRALMTRLARLRNDALDLARHRLPSIVDRLQHGETVDLGEELGRLDHGRDEIGEVAEAFNLAQVTAVNAAVSEANARSGLKNVFLGIAFRNQSLIHQQLQLIDELEQKEENSAQLSALFRLDHLATRARRTTENLIILGDRQPGRRWRKPVTLTEVLRAAISETEQYARVRVEPAPDIAVVGGVVADIVHMIAELVDNATSFSPPDSPVEVTSRTVARGLVIDVSDQGLGMNDDVRQRANQLMLSAPEFDAMAMAADSSLGLFVVARLSARLGTVITFDPSRYGGLRVTVLIPTEHLADTQDADRTGRSGSALSAGPATVPAAEAIARPEPRPTPTPRPRRSEPDVSPAEPSRRPVVAAVAPSPGRTDDRPRLPQRVPQQHLADELKEVSDETLLDAPSGVEAAHSLAAFHRGSRLGREGAEDL